MIFIWTKQLTAVTNTFDDYSLSLDDYNDDKKDSSKENTLIKTALQDLHDKQKCILMDKRFLLSLKKFFPKFKETFIKLVFWYLLSLKRLDFTFDSSRYESIKVMLNF